jgi:CDP-diacylglycerol--serine O-phosphatidyltransferase
MVPNLITSLAACGGISSIAICATNYAKTLAGQEVVARDWGYGFLALLVACVCDAMDGRVARLLKCSSKLGAELDSLADFVNFGVAPAMFMYFWVLAGGVEMVDGHLTQTIPLLVRRLMLVAALFYSMCDAFRLARFNTMLEQPTLPYWKHFFLGVPAPGGCWMVLTPLLLARSLDGVNSVMLHPGMAIGMLIFVGVLMASRIPTVSLKALRISKAARLPTLVGCLLLIACFATNIWLTLGVIGALYILTIPVVVLMFLHGKAKYLRENAGASPERA